MTELQDIKALVIDRVNKYDKHDTINPIEIEMCNSVKEVLNILFNKTSTLYRLKQDNVINTDFLLETFGEETLINEYRIYVSGKHSLYGTYQYYALGDANIRVANDGKVIAFDNAKITLFDKAVLEAYDNVTFQANECSKVKVVELSNVNGTLHWNSMAVLCHNHGHIEAYDNSKVKAIYSSNIDMYGRSEATLQHSSSCRLMEHSTGILCDGATAHCYGKSFVQVRKDATAYLYENTHGYFNDDSRGFCFSADEITCRDNSMVEIHQDVKFTNLYDNSIARILEMGTKLRAYDSSTVQDFADIYTEALGNAVIIWMNRHQVFKNQQKYNADVPFEYKEEDRC